MPWNLRRCWWLLRVRDHAALGQRTPLPSLLCPEYRLRGCQLCLGAGGLEAFVEHSGYSLLQLILGSSSLLGLFQIETHSHPRPPGLHIGQHLYHTPLYWNKLSVGEVRNLLSGSRLQGQRACSVSSSLSRSSQNGVLGKAGSALELLESGCTTRLPMPSPAL